MDVGFIVELVLGILGNIISTFLYLSPILTCKEIHKKKSVEKFSPLPYFAMVLTCGIWLAYGLFSDGMTRILVLITNITGLSLSFMYIMFFAFYADTKKRKQVIVFVVVEVVVLASIVAPLVVKFLIKGHDRNKECPETILGSLGVVANLFLYASPVSLLKKVFETKSVEFWPISTSIASLANGLVWTIYALNPINPFFLIPNILGCVFGITQLIIYAKFKNNAIKDDTTDIVDDSANKDNARVESTDLQIPTHVP